jgi:voltage-gated potassium channel
MRRLLGALAALAGITGLGTAGYMVVEGWPFLDALFMTVTTLATVGYEVVHPLSTAGRVFTVALILAGVGVTLYVLATLAEVLLEGRLREIVQRSAMQRRIDAMSRHIIVCGFGRFGRVVVEELSGAGLPVVVIDKDPALSDELERAGVPHVIGSAVADEVLERAGIRRARAIVVATASDSENVFVTLSARELHPGIEIHARGESEAAVRRLQRAGADHVTSLFRTAGLRAAASILQPTVLDFLEIARPRQGAPVDLEEIRVLPGSPLVGRALSEVEASCAGVRVVALKRANERIRIVPEASTAVGAGDHLVVIGEREPLQTLARRSRTTPGSEAG